MPMIKQYDYVNAYCVSVANREDLESVVTFAYNYSEARALAKKFFKERDKTVGYPLLRAHKIISDVPKGLNGKFCASKDDEGYPLLEKNGYAFE